MIGFVNMVDYVDVIFDLGVGCIVLDTGRAEVD
jgi:hypothetical protein